MKGLMRNWQAGYAIRMNKKRVQHKDNQAGGMNESILAMCEVLFTWAKAHATTI